MKLAFCGLGNMGRAFAGRALETGHAVTVWNRSGGRADGLVKAGAEEADSPAAAAKDADVVFVIVTDDRAALQVILGEGSNDDPVVAGIGRDAHVANISTVSPAAARRLAEEGPAGRVLDTPILGSPTAISDGKGRFLVGGPEPAYDAVKPALDDLAAEVVYCGPAATGATMKLASNLLLIAGVTALAEAVEIARGHGVDDEHLTAALKGGLVMSPAMQLRLSSLLDPEHPGWFGPELARKDVGLATELAEQAKLSARVAPATAALLDRVTGQGWNDFSAVIEAVRAGS